MAGNEFWGEFTISTRVPSEDRYLTVVFDHARWLVGDSGDQSAFRVYKMNDSWVFMTRYLGGYKSQTLRFDFPGGEQTTGEGTLDGYHPKTISPMMMQTGINREGGEINLLLFKSSVVYLVGCAKPFYPDKAEYLYLGDMQALFRPNPWKFRRVRGFNEQNVSFKGLNLTECAGVKAQWKSCDFSESYFTKSSFTSDTDLSGSRFNNAGILQTVFEPGCKLDNTVWQEAQLLSSRLDGCSAMGANFTGALLAYPSAMAGFPAMPASLKGADLRGAKFCNCELNEVDLTNADLRGADFTGTKFNKTILNGAKLSGAIFENADLRQAIFAGDLPKFYDANPTESERKATFKNADIPAAILGKDWTLLDLTSARLHAIPNDLTSLKAHYAVLPSMDLSGRNLTNADFKGSTISDMKFNGANLTGAKLPGLNLKTVKFDGATITGMDITSSDLTGCDLRTVVSTARPVTSKDSKKPTVLASAKLKAGLLGKDWSCVNLNDAMLVDVATTDLTGINAAFVQLTGVDLTGANFNPASADTPSVFRGALLHGANLQKTQFRGANLAGAQFGQLKVAFRMSLPNEAAKQEPSYLRDMLLTAGFTDAGKINLAPVEKAFARVLRSGSSTAAEEHYLRVYLHEDGTMELHVLTAVQPANLSKAYLVDADLTGANLEGVMAKDAHLYGSKTKLNGALMSRIRLVNANLGTADLQGAQMRGATLTDANLVGAKLMRADLTPYDDLASDLSGTYLSGADFTDAKLNGTELSDAAVSTSKGVHLFTLNAESRAELAGGRSFLLSPSKSDAYLKALTKPDKETLKEMFAEETGARRVEITSAATVTSGTQDATEWKIVTSGAQAKTYMVTLEKETRPPSTIVMVLSVKVEGSTEKKKLPDGFLPSYIMALNKEQAAILAPAFANLGMPLGTSPSITVSKRTPASWKLSDPTTSVELMIWTRVFDMGVRGIQVQSPYTALRSLFAKNQQTLIERAEISTSAVDNDWGNTAALSEGYVHFNLLDGEVYGTQLRITRLGENDRLEAAVVPMNEATKLPATAMDGNTRWPNGKTTSEQKTKEQAEAWLWSSELPSPPHCVPSMHGYCPPEK